MANTRKRIYNTAAISEGLIKVSPAMPRQFVYMDLLADNTAVYSTGAQSANGNVSSSSLTNQPDVPRAVKISETYAYTIASIRTASAWVASTAYSAGDEVEPTTANGFVYVCTTAGTSDASEPTWPTTVGDTVTDGTVVWTCHGRWFGISGDVSSDFSANDVITVYGSTGNDGDYTLYSVTYDSGTTTTRLEVKSAVTDTTADGSIGVNGLNSGVKITIEGYDQYGDSVSETLTMSSTGLTTAVSGNQAFLYVTKISWDSAIKGGILVGMTSTIGLPVNIRESGDLKFVTINKVPYLGSDFTVNSVYDTIKKTSGTISANDDWLVHIEA